MNEAKEMPCPACPADCPHHSPTCRPICKTWKAWHKANATPRPKVTEAEAYRNAVNKKVREKMVKRGGRYW